MTKELNTKELNNIKKLEDQSKIAGYWIPIRNKKDGIIAFARVDKHRYEKLNKYKWRMDKDGYAHAAIDGIDMRMNVYVMFLKDEHNHKRSKGLLVDHIYQDRLDNRESMLRYATHSQNSQASLKEKGVYTSDHKGISVNNRDKSWQVHLMHDGITESGYGFKNELHAAYYYNTLVLQFYGSCGFLNKIDEIPLENPKDYIGPAKRKSPYGTYISLTKYNKFQVCLPKKCKDKNNGEICATFDTNEKAIIWRDKRFVECKFQLEDKNKEEETQNKNTGPIQGPIKRNTKGDAIIDSYNNEGVKTTFEVNDDDYFMLQTFSWYSQKGYAKAHKTINGVNKGVFMHRLIIDAAPGTIVDHIDKNPLNNKRSNLRIATPSENSHNREKKKGCTSRHYGICFGDNYYKAYITKEFKTIQKSFIYEIDAVLFYNKTAKKLYNDFANLNIIYEEDIMVKYNYIFEI